MTWKSPEKWKEMLSGEACPMCGDIFEEENQHSFLISELASSYVRLPKNQDIDGRVLVAIKRHANELYDLEPEELAAFWADVSRVAKAVSDRFKPVKIFYGVFGSRCPHLHCHIMPMYESDDPHAPIMLGQAERFLEPMEYQGIISGLRKALESRA